MVMAETPGIVLPPPPPPGLNYIEAIRPSLTFILVLTPLGAVLVPLVITLFVFSSPQSRRHPVFILNVLSCCSGIVEAAVNGALEYNQIVYPLQPISLSLLTCAVTFGVLSPVFIDSILLFRVAAFYPSNTTPLSTRIAIFIFPAVIKGARFAVVVAYLRSFTRAANTAPNVFLAGQSTWPKNPYIISEWTMQMADNAYASGIFLYKLWSFHRGQNGLLIFRTGSILSRIRSLFLIALGNFIFPVIMNIAQIVLITSDPSFINGTYVLLTNNYVAILGVVFATVWTGRQHWNQRASVPATRVPRPTFDRSTNSGPLLSTLGPSMSHDHRGQETDSDTIVDSPRERKLKSLEPQASYSGQERNLIGLGTFSNV